MQKRYSKKREAIIALLKSTKEHPSAEWIYDKLRLEFPDLSLATVYRNLNELVATGEIASVAVVGDKERFDYDTAPHTHAICTVCGKVIDVYGVTLPDAATLGIKEMDGFCVKETKLQLVGVCKDCQDSQKIEK